MDIQVLMQSGKAKKFPNGHLIIRQGDEMGNEMYIILDGSVDVYKNYKAQNEVKIASLSAGNFFGEMTLFLHSARSATVVATGDVVCLVIERHAAYKFFETQPQLTYSILKTLCQRLDDTNATLSGANIPIIAADKNPSEKLFTPSAPVKPAPVAAPAMISDTPPPGFISDTPPAQTSPASVSSELFPEGHKIYDIPAAAIPSDLVYKKNFKCPVCEHTFPAYSVRTTRLKSVSRDKDFRNHYNSIDTSYYEMVTCPECYFSMFDASYTQPIISRFKENIGQITAFKNQLQIDIVNDRNINNVLAGYFLGLKGAPLFYKSYEMFAAKMWLRIKWLYADAEDKEMEEMAAKEAHKAYLLAFEKTDASPEAIQQLCVLMGELSLIVKDISNAKLFFVKARTYKNGSKAMISQAEDGIETIRKIESGQIQL